MVLVDARVDGNLVVGGVKEKQCLADGTWDTTAADTSTCFAVGEKGLQQFDVAEVAPEDTVSESAITTAVVTRRRLARERREEIFLDCDSSFIEIVAACPPNIDFTIPIDDPCLAEKILSAAGTWLNIQGDAAPVLNCRAVRTFIACQSRAVYVNLNFFPSGWNVKF